MWSVIISTECVCWELLNWGWSWSSLLLIPLINCENRSDSLNQESAANNGKHLINFGFVARQSDPSSYKICQCLNYSHHHLVLRFEIKFNQLFNCALTPDMYDYLKSDWGQDVSLIGVGDGGGAKIFLSCRRRSSHYIWISNPTTLIFNCLAVRNSVFVWLFNRWDLQRERSNYSFVKAIGKHKESVLHFNECVRGFRVVVAGSVWGVERVLLAVCWCETRRCII